MRTNQSCRRLRVKASNLRDAARDVFGATRDYEIADLFKIEPAALSRLMTHTTQPSEKVIIAALDLLGRPFEELFEIVSEVKQ